MDTLNAIAIAISLLLCLAGLMLWYAQRLKARQDEDQRGRTGGRKPLAKGRGKRTKSRQRPGLQPARHSRAGAGLSDFIARYHVWIVIILMVVAVGVRLWRFPDIPPGLNQDEASIGYDSFAIGNYGMDRNGDFFPVYPIAFGDGHGPLYTYLSIPAIKLLGLSVFSFRLTNVLLGCLSTFFFYLLVKRVAGRNTGLCALALMATCPTSILSSRWALDSNPLPFLFIMAVYLFIVASEKQKTWLYALSAAAFALTVYAYGPAGVVAPLFLLLSCLYLIYHKKLRWSQFFVGMGAFLVVFAPLGIFLAINMFDLPAIRTSFISFPKFTVARTGDVLIHFDRMYLINFAINTAELLKLLILQRQDLIWNMTPGFGATYLFTSPLIILGAVVTVAGIRPLKRYHQHVIMLVWLAAALLMSLLLWVNVNRVGIIYPAILFLIAMAIRFLYRQGKALALLAGLLTAVFFGLFVWHYFNVYPEVFGPSFFYSFGDALEDAQSKTDGVIYVTETNQMEPSVITLFYSGLPPGRFVDTVKYYDDKAEWRNAMYFDRYRFGIPWDKDPTAVYVAHPSEVRQFDASVFAFDEFAYYTVVYPKPR